MTGVQTCALPIWLRGCHPAFTVTAFDTKINIEHAVDIRRVYPLGMKNQSRVNICAENMDIAYFYAHKILWPLTLHVTHINLYNMYGHCTHIVLVVSNIYSKGLEIEIKL